MIITYSITECKFSHMEACVIAVQNFLHINIPLYNFKSSTSEYFESVAQFFWQTSTIVT